MVLKSMEDKKSTWNRRIPGAFLLAFLKERDRIEDENQHSKRMSANKRRTRRKHNDYIADF